MATRSRSTSRHTGQTGSGSTRDVKIDRIGPVTIYQRRDETIRGHVFCSFLALVLRQELEARLAAAVTNSSGPT